MNVAEKISAILRILLLSSAAYDLIIANPQYARTQIMGSGQSPLIAKQLSLSGRIDLYYAFTLGIAQALKTNGVAGIIVSNRFRTANSGGSLRKSRFGRLCLQQVWDLGDRSSFVQQFYLLYLFLAQEY